MPPEQDALLSPLARAWLAAGGVVLFGLIGLLTLHQGHPPGGDFAQYIIHARNLWEGRPYGQGILMPGIFFHNYPPGFPALLAPLLAWDRLNLALLASLNLVFWPLACWALAALARRRLGPELALYLFLFMLLTPWFFSFKQAIVSDVPFTCLVLVALWAFTVWERGGPRRWAWLVLFLASLAASLLVRSAAVALVGAALLVMVLKHRAWGAAGLTVLVALAAVGLQKAMGAGTGGYFVLLHDPMSWLSRVVWGLAPKLAKIVGFFFPVYRGGHALVAGLEALAALPLLAVAAWGWWKRRRRLGDWSVLDAFVALYLLMILTWPFVEGPRLYAPVAGMLVLLFLEGLQEWLQRRPRPLAGRTTRFWLSWVLLAGLALNLLNIGLLWDSQADVVARPADRELYAWVRAHAHPGQAYIYPYPRIIALFSGQVGDKYNYKQTLAVQKKRMLRRSVKWLILPRPERAAELPSARRQFSWLFHGSKGEPPAMAEARADPGLYLAWQNHGYRVFGLKNYPDPGLAPEDKP